MTGYEDRQADRRGGDVLYDRLGTLLSTCLPVPVLVWPLIVGCPETPEKEVSMLDESSYDKQASGQKLGKDLESPGSFGVTGS